MMKNMPDKTAVAKKYGMTMRRLRRRLLSARRR